MVGYVGLYVSAYYMYVCVCMTVRRMHGMLCEIESESESAAYRLGYSQSTRMPRPIRNLEALLRVRLCWSACVF